MNKENLLKMADYLETLEPEKFDISVYSEDGELAARDVEHLCGSVGCVVGNAPRVFGVEERDWSDSTGFFQWLKYSNRIFELNAKTWDWCFSSFWSSIDNTPKGAALRLRYLVEKGLPEDCFKQMLGESTYMFKDQIGESNE